MDYAKVAKMELSENEVSKIVFDCALKVHKTLDLVYWKVRIKNVYIMS